MFVEWLLCTEKLKKKKTENYSLPHELECFLWFFAHMNLATENSSVSLTINGKTRILVYIIKTFKHINALSLMPWGDFYYYNRITMSQLEWLHSLDKCVYMYMYIHICVCVCVFFKSLNLLKVNSFWPTKWVSLH